MTSPPSARCRLRQTVALSYPMTSPRPGTTTPSSLPSARCPSPRSTLTVQASQRWPPVVFSTALKRPTQNRWSTSSPQGWSREPALRPPWRGTGRGAHHRRTDPPQKATNVRVRVFPTEANCLSRVAHIDLDHGQPGLERPDRAPSPPWSERSDG